MNKKSITTGGLRPVPGQKAPVTIILTQPRKFNIDIADYVAAVHSAENIDYYRRTKLYDLYDDIMLDSHLESVINRRRSAVNSSQIVFLKNGAPDDAVNDQLRSPWFDTLVADIVDARFFGFSLMQFRRDSHGWISYDLIPRKHADPVRREILHLQGSLSGTPWDEFPNMLFVGQARGLGLLAKAAPWVIYKRNDMADWAQFAEIFGMPIRDYTYETGDDDARERVKKDAQDTGALAVYIHPKDVELELRESGNKTGSADLYDKLCERCNRELSKLFLGNTLTTESQATGTQALGTVHKKEEDQILKSDQKFVLNVLNYDMTDIFSAMGIDTNGGEFQFSEPKLVDLTAKANILVQLQRTFNLPVSDEYLYETFGIEKPKNYEQLKKEQENKTYNSNPTLALPQEEGGNPQGDGGLKKEGGRPAEKGKPSVKGRLSRFFG